MSQFRLLARQPEFQPLREINRSDLDNDVIKVLIATTGEILKTKDAVAKAAYMISEEPTPEETIEEEETPTEEPPTPRTPRRTTTTTRRGRPGRLR